MAAAISELVLPSGVHVGELHLHVVTHLVADRTVHEDGQVEVLVGEGVVPTEGPLGHGRSDVGLVVLVDDTIVVHVNILHVTGIDGVLGVVVGRIGAPRLGSVRVGNDGVVLVTG